MLVYREYGGLRAQCTRSDRCEHSVAREWVSNFATATFVPDAIRDVVH